MVQSKKLKQTVAVLGGGKMGGGLITGWLKTGLLAPSQIYLVEPDNQLVAHFKKLRVPILDGPNACRKADAVLVAVKPQILADVLPPLATALKGKLAISIAAGISTSSLQAWVPGARWIRAMPNQPATVGDAATGLFASNRANKADQRLANSLFTSVGSAIWLPNEALLHAVTGLSGSGPAFVAVFAEALEDAGVKAGLARAQARQLALATLSGSAQQMLKQNLAPAQLKDAVTSPAGTTIAGLQALEQGGLRAAIIAAVEAAIKRSRELGGD